MPQPFGHFGIWTEGNTTKAKRFVVWVDPHNETETIVIHCQTPNEAERSQRLSKRGNSRSNQDTPQSKKLEAHMTQNPPNIDKIIVWHGFGYPHQRGQSWESMCRVRIWQKQLRIVLLSDLDEEDTGTSITNCAENIATLVQLHFQLENPIRWFEHYPRHNHSPRQLKDWPETVDEVFYDHDGERYRNPKWKPFDRNAFEKLVNYSSSMDGYKFLPKITLKTPWEQSWRYYSD